MADGEPGQAGQLAQTLAVKENMLGQESVTTRLHQVAVWPAQEIPLKANTAMTNHALSQVTFEKIKED